MNYLGYFNLRAEPFSHAPLTEFYYASRQHSDALNRLTHVVSAMKGLAVLVGDVGRGKTTLARRLLDSLPEAEYEAAMLVIVHAAVGPSWLLRRVATQLGVTDPSDDNLQLLSQLYKRLVEIHESGKRAVVLIDEAQMLASRPLMEEFRGLLNLELPGHKLITFVFFGLPELEENLRLDPPLAQRVALRFELKGLNEDDTMAYVRHRLTLAGAETEIFDDASLHEVHVITGGLPRVINTLCDNVLLELFFAQERFTTPAQVRHVAAGLNMSAPAPAAAPAALPAATPSIAASVRPPAPVAARPAAPPPPFADDAMIAPASRPAVATPSRPAPNMAADAMGMARRIAEEAPDDFDNGKIFTPSPADEVMGPPPEQSVEYEGDDWLGITPAAEFLANHTPKHTDAPRRTSAAQPAAMRQAQQTPAATQAQTPPPRPAPAPANPAPRSAVAALDLDDVDDLLAELKNG